MIFLGLLTTHILVVLFVKWKTSIVFVNEYNWLDKCIHSIENTNIPHNAQEWDTAKGNANEHKKRMKANLKENVAMIWIKAFFNLMLHMPICYLGKYTFFKIMQFVPNSINFLTKYDFS